jgi:hypothetical protein
LCAARRLCGFLICRFVKLANREKQCSTALKSIEPMFQSYIDVAYACQSDADFTLSAIQPNRAFARLNAIQDGRLPAAAASTVHAGGTIEAFCGVGASGILWANFQPTMPKRVRSFNAFLVGQSPASLWASPHLVIEADVGRTYGVVTATASSDALASFHDAPLPKYASGSLASTSLNF